MTYFLRLLGIRQQLEKYIKIENYYSITKQIIKIFKKSVDKSSNIDDIQIYFILKWTEYKYQSIKISKFKKSQTIPKKNNLWNTIR
jgi:hypothetical protein